VLKRTLLLVSLDPKELQNLLDELRASRISRNSGFWFAFFDKDDAYATEAQKKAHYIDAATIIFPWPILYETVNTTFAKHAFWMDQFERLLKRDNVKMIDDSAYRSDALRNVFFNYRKRPLALCDMILRLVIDDATVRIDSLLTFNEKDFADVCRARGVEIIY